MWHLFRRKSDHHLRKVWKFALIFVIFIAGIAGYFGYKIFFMSGLKGPEINGKIEKFTFRKEELNDYGINQDVKLQIYLPFNYDPAKSYPIIFLLDGDDMFKGAAGYLSQMIGDHSVPEAILVGIGYGYLNGYWAPKDKGRWRDYALPEDPEFGKTANAPRFYRFLSKELVPIIIDKYHGLPEQSTLIGHSMGGDFTYYAFLMYDPSLGDKNPFINFIIGDGGNEDHFAAVYTPPFEKRMAQNNNQTHTPLILYRVWGYLVYKPGLKGMEDLHKWLTEKNYNKITAYRYYPLADDHAATMKTTVINGIKVTLGSKSFLDYSDKSSFHF